MPLQELHTIDLNAPFWQGWRYYLHYQRQSPSLDQQEGAVASFLNTLITTHIANTQAFYRDNFIQKIFVPQSLLPDEVAYETFIFQQNKIPTRDGLHDFFNGLCWLTFPQTKTTFNQLHQQQIEKLGTQQRGKIRDHLTILDENGFLIYCPDELWDALYQKNWIKAFWELRPLWSKSKVMVFGHALLEKLISPYPAITAHAIRIPSTLFTQRDISLSITDLNSPSTNNTTENTLQISPQGFSYQEKRLIDTYLASLLTEEYLVEKPYIPLQIFGIPLWTQENENILFYQNKKIFRPAKLNG